MVNDGYYMVIMMVIMMVNDGYYEWLLRWLLLMVNDG